MIFDEIWRLNPVKLFLESAESLPGMKSNYKTTLFLLNIAPLIRKKLVQPNDEILSLYLGSDPKEIILQGEYDPKQYFWARFLRVKVVEFEARLKVVSIDGNVVRFKFSHYSLKNPNRKHWDWVRWFSRFDPIHKKRILRKIVNLFPEVLRLTPIQWEVLFNLNYFLNQVPSIAGNIQVIGCEIRSEEIDFRCRSSVMLKPLADFFGPEYIKVKYLGEGDLSKR
jgi:hypothetical protein